MADDGRVVGPRKAIGSKKTASSKGVSSADGRVVGPRGPLRDAVAGGVAGGSMSGSDAGGQLRRTQTVTPLPDKSALRKQIKGVKAKLAALSTDSDLRRELHPKKSAKLEKKLAELRKLSLIHI